MIGIALGVAWLCCLAFFCGVLVAEKDRGWSCLEREEPETLDESISEEES